MTLDGAPYSVMVAWNLAAQRWFINVHDADRNLIVCRSLVGSPVPRALAPPPGSLAVSAMSWDDDDGGRLYFTLVDPAPASVQLGSQITVSGALNDGTAGDGAVNGSFVIDQFTDPSSFSALLTAAAGEIGTITGDIQIAITVYALVWRRGVVTATAAEPHDLPLGSVVRLTIDGQTPSGYAGSYYCVITGPSEFRYRLASDPGGPATRAGSYSSDLNLVDGYFITSSLVYREDSSQFEARP